MEELAKINPAVAVTFIVCVTTVICVYLCAIFDYHPFRKGNK